VEGKEVEEEGWRALRADIHVRGALDVSHYAPSGRNVEVESLGYQHVAHITRAANSEIEVGCRRQRARESSVSEAEKVSQKVVVQWKKNAAVKVAAQAHDDRSLKDVFAS